MIKTPGTTFARRTAGRAADRVADALAWRLSDRVAATAATAATGSAPLDELPPDESAAPSGEGVPGQQHIDREGQDNAHVELMLGWMLRDESNCIDVGANEGRFLAHIVNRAKHGTHLAWEPLPEFAERARREFPTVEVHQAALSDHAGQAEFVYVPELPAYSSLRERSYPSEVHPERIQVQLERLDDSLPEGYVPHFIKIDVEGAEREVIEGGLETIARHRPIVVFEHGLGAADRYGTTPEHIWDLLAGTAKLHIFDMDAVGPLSRDHFSEIFASGERWNYIALP